MKKFLQQQFEKDKHLLKTPKEILFIGKPNCGKSSLINDVLEFKSCRISKKPGCTKYFNFYETKMDQG